MRCTLQRRELEAMSPSLPSYPSCLGAAEWARCAASWPELSCSGHRSGHRFGKLSCPAMRVFLTISHPSARFVQVCSIYNWPHPSAGTTRWRGARSKRFSDICCRRESTGSIPAYALLLCVTQQVNESVASFQTLLRSASTRPRPAVA